MNSLDFYTMLTNAQIAFGLATIALLLALLFFRVSNKPSKKR